MGTALILPSSYAQTSRNEPDRADQDAVIRIESKPNIDENLFLVRVLENLYGALPQFEGDTTAFRSVVEDVRHEVKRHLAYIREKDIEKSIGEMYADFLKVLDSYEESTLKVFNTSEKAESRKSDTFNRDVTKSSVFGGELAGGALATGAGLGTAVGIWAVGSLMDYLLEAEDQTGLIEEAKLNEIARIAKEYEKLTEEAIANARSRCLRLSQAHDWKEAEFGFDNDPRFAQSIERSIEAGDFHELSRLRNIECRNRPRDPFAFTARALAIVIKKDLRASELNEKAEECFEAASMVPAGSFYDTYRRNFVELSAILSTTASQMEIGDAGWVSAPAPSAGRAVRFCRTLLHYDELDETGSGRSLLAWALACQGRHRDALKTAESVIPLRGGDSEFLYNLTCLLCINDRVGIALGFFDIAVKEYGFNDIAKAKTDPDLAKLREQKGQEFKDLTSVKFEWKVDWGILSDDVCVENRSAFPLTNVRFDVHISSEGYPDWRETLTADVILPGQTVRWNTRIGSRGQKPDGKGSLEADQNR